MKILNKNLDFQKDFKDYLTEANKPKQVTTTTYCGYWEEKETNYYDCGDQFPDSSDKIDVYFYEWSDMNSKARHYKSRKSFLKFLEDSHIFVSEYTKNYTISGTLTLYCACQYGKAELSFRYSKANLKSFLESHTSYAL